MPDGQMGNMRYWARRVSIDAGQSAHNPHNARAYAGHCAGTQNWAAKVGLDFGRPEQGPTRRKNGLAD